MVNVHGTWEAHCTCTWDIHVYMVHEMYMVHETFMVHEMYTVEYVLSMHKALGLIVNAVETNRKRKLTSTNSNLDSVLKSLGFST